MGTFMMEGFQRHWSLSSVSQPRVPCFLCALLLFMFTKIICIVNNILEKTFISKSDISKFCVLFTSCFQYVCYCIVMLVLISIVLWYMCTIIFVWLELFRGYIWIFSKYSLMRHWLASKSMRAGTEQNELIDLTVRMLMEAIFALI